MAVRSSSSATFLAQTANDAWEVPLATFANPIAGISVVFKKIADKAKEEKAKKTKP